MSVSSNDEILSAYFDGEAAPDECDRVTQWLSELPPEATEARERASGRETLDAYARISELLHSLPVVPPPDDLAAGVMQAVRATRATPQQAPALLTASGTSRLQRGRGRGSRGVLVVGLLAVCAALLVVVSRPKTFDQPAADSDAVAAREIVSPTADTARSVDAATPGPPAGAESAALSLPADQAKVRSPPQVGEVLQFVRRSGDQVAVVEVTVVDVRQALGVTQVLLAGLDSAPTESTDLNAAGSELREAENIARETSEYADPEWLWGVYVQGPSQQVADFVQRMSHEKTFQAFEPTAWVEAERIQQQRLDLAPAARTAQRRLVDTRTAVPEAGPAVREFQTVRVRLGATGRPLEGTRRRQTYESLPPPAAGAAGARDDGDDRDGGPVRVVFVFRPQSAR